MFDSNSDLTPFQPSFPQFSDLPDDTDERPLPLRVADGNPDPENGWPTFPLAYHKINGEYYYALQDWIRGVAQMSDVKAVSKLIKNVKLRLQKEGIESSLAWRTLAYRSSDNKVYQRDHIDANGLYQITQRLSTTTGLRNRILAYLSAAGVIVDDQRIEAVKAQKQQNVVPPPIDEVPTFDFDEAFEALVAVYRKMYRDMGRDDKWISARVRSAIQRKKFTDAFQKAMRENPTKFQFAEITDDMRRGLWKRSTAQLRRQMGLAADVVLRDHMPEIGLNYEALAESISEAELKQNEALTFEQAEAIVSANARSLRPHVARTSERLGIDIPTGKPLLPAKTGKPKTKPAQT